VWFIRLPRVAGTLGGGKGGGVVMFSGGDTGKTRGWAELIQIMLGRGGGGGGGGNVRGEERKVQNRVGGEKGIRVGGGGGGGADWGGGGPGKEKRSQEFVANFGSDGRGGAGGRATSINFAIL